MFTGDPTVQVPGPGPPLYRVWAIDILLESICELLDNVQEKYVGFRAFGNGNYDFQTHTWPKSYYLENMTSKFDATYPWQC